MQEENSWEGREEEELRKIGLEHLNNTLDRQNEEIEIQRGRLEQFMKYHLLIIGFIITLPNIGQEAFAIVEKWEVGIAILPSVIGIAHALGAHKSIGNYDIGFDSDIYEDLLRKENEFVDALKTLSETYDKMIDNNREHLNNNWRHLVIQMILFGASLGVITASIVI